MCVFRLFVMPLAASHISFPVNGVIKANGAYHLFLLENHHATTILRDHLSMLLLSAILPYCTPTLCSCLLLIVRLRSALARLCSHFDALKSLCSL